MHICARIKCLNVSLAQIFHLSSAINRNFIKTKAPEYIPVDFFRRWTRHKTVTELAVIL